jgi:hypothetical protein
MLEDRRARCMLESVYVLADLHQQQEQDRGRGLLCISLADGCP